jgi:hypothetical protein
MSSLVSSLKSPLTNDPVSLFIREKLSDHTLRLMSHYTRGTNDLLKQYLSDDFNQIIQGPLIYESTRFAGISLSSNTLQLLHSDARDSQLVELNQRLLLATGTRRNCPRLQGYPKKLFLKAVSPSLRVFLMERGISLKGLRSQHRNLF